MSIGVTKLEIWTYVMHSSHHFLYYVVHPSKLPLKIKKFQALDIHPLGLHIVKNLAMQYIAKYGVMIYVTLHWGYYKNLSKTIFGNFVKMVYSIFRKTLL